MNFFLPDSPLCRQSDQIAAVLSNKFIIAEQNPPPHATTRHNTPSLFTKIRRKFHKFSVILHTDVIFVRYNIR